MKSAVYQDIRSGPLEREYHTHARRAEEEGSGVEDYRPRNLPRISISDMIPNSNLLARRKASSLLISFLKLGLDVGQEQLRRVRDIVDPTLTERNGPMGVALNQLRWYNSCRRP